MRRRRLGVGRSTGTVEPAVKWLEERDKWTVLEELTDGVKAEFDSGDQALLHTLPAAGLSTPAVVALAQWIAFLSYQARLVSGLQALQRWRAA